MTKKVFPTKAALRIKEGKKYNILNASNYSYHEVICSVFDFTCVMCKKWLRRRERRLHHKIPMILGGKNTIDNIVLLCKDCHKKVHSKD